MMESSKVAKGLKSAIVFVIIFLATAFFLLIRTTTVSNMYCGFCHFKEKELVRTSSVHNLNNSSCAGCHDISPFSISKHFSSDKNIINEKCVKCHEEIKVSKEVKKKNLIKMNHLSHMDGKKTNMKCVDCHSNAAHDMGVYATNRPSMLSCFAGECHAKEKDLKKCDYCHYVKLAYPEN